MTPSPARSEPIEGIHRLYLPDPDTLNAQILQQFARAKQSASCRQTHHFHGRFENTYVDSAQVPALQTVFEYALQHARSLLALQDLRFGFWFNEMGPGHRTSLHAHEEEDELLSAVYYITVPTGSGRLLLHLGDEIHAVDPEPGMLLLFPPSLPHEVETNRSGETRLSVAFNFGPPETD